MGLPIPDSEIGALIAKSGYMPPIVPLQGHMEKAWGSYMAMETPILLHPELLWLEDKA